MHLTRILIVDDHPFYAETLASRIAAPGWEIEAATSGEEALKLIQDGLNFDILASDFLMPGGMDGAELVNRALAVQPDLFTIIFTAYKERNHAVKALHAGADLFLDKSDGIDQHLQDAIQRGGRQISLGKIGRLMLGMNQEEEIVDLIFEEIGRLDVFEGCCLAVRGRTGASCHVERAENLTDGSRLPGGEIKQADSAYRYVIEEQTVYLPPLFKPKKRQFTPFLEDSRSIVVVPLVRFAGERGALGVESHSPDAFQIADLRFLNQVADRLSLALDNVTHRRRAYVEHGTAWSQHNWLARQLRHLIKTPLSHISMIADPETSGLDDEDRTTLTDAVDKIDYVVEDMLQRLIEPQAAPESVDVAAIVRDAVAWLRLGDSDVSARPHLDFAPGLPKVDGRPELLTSAFVNLLENAATAATEIRIHASYVRARDRVEIVVQDDGPGISAEVADRIFDYGVSTKGEGHGFGLALTKDIVVVQHGGTIDLVTSAKAEGATFKVSLPVKAR